MVISKKRIESLKAEMDSVKGNVDDFKQLSSEKKELIMGSLAGLSKTLEQGVDATIFNIIKTAYDGLKPSIEYAYEMENLATEDLLTGLLNRTGIEKLGAKRADYAQRNNHSVGVFFLDLNKFKPINDTLGHDEGDKALEFVGEKLQETMRSSDLLSRYGGDEFVIILMNDDPHYSFSTEQKKLENLFDGNVTYQGADGNAYPIGASIGMAKLAEGEDIAAAIKRADKIMYIHKQESEHSRSNINPPSPD